MVDPSLLPLDPHRLPDPGEWFAPDAARHLLDRPKFCPTCGGALDNGMITEYWRADDRVFYTWCPHCMWTGTIVKVDRATIFEAEH